MQFQFGEFLLDTHSAKLLSAGSIINDEERVVRTLQILCEAYPNYADKDHLISQVWSDQVVTDWSLSKLISDIRQILGDTGKDQGYIKTVRGKGFKLNVPVTTVDNESGKHSIESGRSQSKSWLSAIVGIAIIVVITSVFFIKPKQEKKSVSEWPRQIAVLPVTNESSTSAPNDWVKYGVMSLVAEQLNSYNSLQVIPVKNVIGIMPTAEELASLTNADLFDSLCSKLGCTELIQISYRVENKLPTLTYYIIQSNQSTKDYVATSTDVMDVTTQLIDHMVESLLPGDVDIKAVEQKLTGNDKADRELAMGMHELYSGDLQTARNYLQLAHDREPDFFWVDLYLAEVEYRSGNLELAENNIQQLDTQRLTTEQAYFLQHLYSNVLYSKGDLDESLATTRALTINQFAQQNPILLGNEYLNIGSSLQASGNNIDAIEAFEKANSLYSEAGYLSGEGKVLFNLGNVYLTNSEPKKAIESYIAAREIFTRFGMTGYALMAKHQVASTNLYLGNIQTAEGELRQLIKAYQEIGDTEGYYTAELDLANVSMAQKDYAEGLIRITALLDKLEGTELSYLLNHALVIASKCYLMTGDSASAAQSYAKISGEWTDVRPAFALIPAHILHDQGNLAAAVAKAEDIKNKLDSQWTSAHQEILVQMNQSLATGVLVKLDY